MSPLYDHRNKEALKGMERINIGEYLDMFLGDLSRIENRPAKLNTDFDAIRIKGLLDSPQNTRFKSIPNLKTRMPYWNEQRVDYVSSNLGQSKGFIFYFLCNGCEKRVKYLYQYDIFKSPLCRTCCRITYKRQSKRGLPRTRREERFSIRVGEIEHPGFEHHHQSMDRSPKGFIVTGLEDEEGFYSHDRTPP